MIADFFWASLCHAYQLGKVKNVQQVPGGLLHTLFHLQTTKGDYAVKALNDLPSLQHNLLPATRSQQVANVLAQQKVPALVALSLNGEYVFQYNKKHYLVFPWINGEVRDSQALSLSDLRLIGKILATIHQAKMTGFYHLPVWHGLEQAQWLALLQGIQTNTRLYHFFEQKIAHLAKWSLHAKQADKILSKTVIFSHRDFDHKNTLWIAPGKPILLDWEYSGLINPGLDLLIVALNWSGIQKGMINEQSFKAVIEGFYREIKTSVPLGPLTVASYIGYCLDWLIYNFTVLSQDQLAIEAENQLKHTYHAIQLVISKTKQILTWYDEALSSLAVKHG